MNASLERRLLIWFLVSMLALGGIGLLSYRSTENLTASENWIDHTYQVIAALETGTALLTDVETKQRGFLLTGDEMFLKDCQAGQSQVDGWLKTVRTLTADNPEQQRQLDTLQSLIKTRLA